MKTLFKNFPRAATCSLVIALAPVVSVAQDVPGNLGLANRSLGQLTLLPGPSLLSPARGAPQSTPAISIAPSSLRPGANDTNRFVPAFTGGWKPTLQNGSAGTMIVGPAGTLTLSSAEPASPSEPPNARKRLPPADSLRFDATLSPLKIERSAAPR
ncbi:MAG: hypothetical protein EXS37_21385 [Opitutus sp.]|nr:hypothetical protein [Opitutus sp.]